MIFIVVYVTCGSLCMTQLTFGLARDLKPCKILQFCNFKNLTDDHGVCQNTKSMLVIIITDNTNSWLCIAGCSQSSSCSLYKVWFTMPFSAMFKSMLALHLMYTIKRLCTDKLNNSNFTLSGITWCYRVNKLKKSPAVPITIEIHNLC